MTIYTERDLTHARAVITLRMPHVRRAAVTWNCALQKRTADALTKDGRDNMNAGNYKKTEYNDPFIAQRADPYIVKADDGSFYFTASVPEYDRIVLRHSDTLMGLREAEEKEIWHKHSGGKMSKHIWAPELHFIDGGWYIYFAAGEEEDIWNIKPWVLHCKGMDPVNDEWEECGNLKRAEDDEFSFNSFSLDMTVFENKGKNYVIWAEKVNIGKAISNLYIAELASPTVMKTAQVLLTTPDYDWERVGFWVNEGPTVLHHNGKIYMTFSASSTGECYCLGMMTANEDSDLLDPLSWKKDRYPVLKSDRLLGFYGPGHNTFFKGEDGCDMMSYHSRTYDEIVGDPLYDPNRHCYIMKIVYDNTGRPVFDFKNNILKRV